MIIETCLLFYCNSSRINEIVAGSYCWFYCSSLVLPTIAESADGGAALLFWHPPDLFLILAPSGLSLISGFGSELGLFSRCVDGWTALESWPWGLTTSSWDCLRGLQGLSVEFKAPASCCSSVDVGCCWLKLCCYLWTESKACYSLRSVYSMGWCLDRWEKNKPLRVWLP